MMPAFMRLHLVERIVVAVIISSLRLLPGNPRYEDLGSNVGDAFSLLRVSCFEAGLRGWKVERCGIYRINDDEFRRHGAVGFC
jgi:hypothetical protein